MTILMISFENENEKDTVHRSSSNQSSFLFIQVQQVLTEKSIKKIFSVDQPKPNLREKKKKLANGGIEPRTVTLLHSKRSGPLYIPVKNAICKSHISDRQHWEVSIGKP